MDQFALGMLLALLYRARPASSWWTLPALIAMILALVAALAGFHWLGGFPVIAWYKLLWPTTEGLLWAGFIYLYLVLFNRQLQLPGRMLARLGEISYSLYLTHLIVVELFVRYNLTVLPRTAPQTLNALITTLVFILPASIAFSTLTYHLIEKPFLELRRAYLVRSPDAPQSLELPTSLGSQKASVLPPSGEAN
jgi:peptidoglycan/LPS O-acetylase OafA/YrhL